MDASFWSARSVFVTGASGLLGGHLVSRLVSLGASVVCLVRDWVPNCQLVRTGLIDKVAVVRGDVRGQAVLERALGEFEVETVFHLAAQTIVGIAGRNPVSTFQTNIGGVWSLLEAARRSPKLGQVVIASSDKAYGDQERLPYGEDTPLQGRWPYDVSKSCADLIARSYAMTYRLPVAITRCGNLYGPGDLNWNRIIPGTIRSCARGERPVIRSDGKFVRDYIYIEDAVEGYLLLAQRLAEKAELAGEAFNFSAEQPVSVLALVEVLLKLMGCSGLRPQVLGEASREIRAQYLSAAKAREQLGWRARCSLEEGLRRTVAWYREFLRTPSQSSERKTREARNRTSCGAEQHRLDKPADPAPDAACPAVGRLLDPLTR